MKYPVPITVPSRLIRSPQPNTVATFYYSDFNGNFSGEDGLKDAAGVDFVGDDADVATAPGTLPCIPAAASLPCNQDLGFWVENVRFVVYDLSSVMWGLGLGV